MTIPINIKSIKQNPFFIVLTTCKKFVTKVSQEGIVNKENFSSIKE